MKTLSNNYIFKALDAFPYDLEETIEALTYALAYDEKNTTALCLMGRVYAESLKDYEKAKEYFTEVLAEDIHAFQVYPHYIKVLLWNEDLKEAEKLIDFALTIKGSDKAVLYVGKAQLLEQKQEYKKALTVLKQARIHTCNSNYLYVIDEEKARIKSKLPKKKKEKERKR
ncbi:tetratricopeptide repeat protein [Tenacibaculum amylolyticum]|uniref:tetratricopeptide repeat protein n=1 Tax=Tenacibaculum amylolyticum TaxID=104269 RepID=UPI003895A595